MSESYLGGNFGGSFGGKAGRMSLFAADFFEDVLCTYFSFFWRPVDFVFFGRGGGGFGDSRRVRPFITVRVYPILQSKSQMAQIT